jgi:lipoprotein-anchoring transpeptidase ErfK/SrfK
MSGIGGHPARRPARAAASARPRYDRICALGGAVAVTVVSGLGGLGLLPAGAPAGSERPVAQARVNRPASAPVSQGPQAYLAAKPTEARSSDQSATPALPAGSGTGRRIVFAIGLQRVWLVDRQAGKDVVRRTYLASGSLTDNLRPGSYQVYSKSRHAIGVDDSGTMQYMVRFAHGQHAAIGFHDIPVLDGKLVESRDDLGSPRSHGCIRQWRPDARALWRFAPVGTRVVVVA